MPADKPDYFRYFPVFPEITRWGLGVTASGLTCIGPSSSYPPCHHPENHHFDWEHGRVLDAFQVVLISSGCGWLETHADGILKIETGHAFLLHPGVWHRYRPDPETGWNESWAEIQGPVMEALLESGSISTRTVASGAGLEVALDRIHQLSRNPAGGFQPELSAAAMAVLACCARTKDKGPEPTGVQRAVLAAERHLNHHHAEEVNVEELAKSLGVAYSHFRRAFREHTGFAPWQYVIHLRLGHARRLLASSANKLDEVAARVGFNSGFHLSLAFKKAYGVSPAHWKKSLQSNQAASASHQPPAASRRSSRNGTE